MALTRIGGANAITGTIPQGNIANASLGAVTALPTGLGGKVLQVVQAVKTDVFYNSGSTSFTDITGLSLAITPSANSSKVLVLLNINIGSQGSQTVRLLRDSTAIYIGDSASNRPLGFINVVDLNQYGLESTSGIFLDQPNTSSQINYKIQMISSGGGGGEYFVNRSRSDRDTAQYDPRTASSITLLEIGS